MTLESKSTTEDTQIENVNWTEDKETKEDFKYLKEVCRDAVRNHETIKAVVMRIASKMADKYFQWDQPAMCSRIESIFISSLHNDEIFEFDSLIESVFNSAAWKDQLHTLEQSYQRFGIDYNNPLGSRKRNSQKDMEFSTAIHVLKNSNLSGTKLQDALSEVGKTYEGMIEQANRQRLAVPPSNIEVQQTKEQSMKKKIDQLKTPEYKIEEIHKTRQEIVKEGLDACIRIFTAMRDEVIEQIPIQTDAEAYSWRDGFIDLANNFTALGDDKHRMDFAGWAKTLENIEKYGAEKGLKMSGCEITQHDLNLIDKDTLPLHYYEKYDKIGLSYISKEHLDSKGVLIANAFVDMENRFSWLAAAAQMFSYQAKIRGIRAIAVSNKLSNSK